VLSVCGGTPRCSECVAQYLVGGQHGKKRRGVKSIDGERIVFNKKKGRGIIKKRGEYSSKTTQSSEEYIMGRDYDIEGVNW